MIDFQQEDHTQERIIGGVATVIYAVLVLLMLLLLKFQLTLPPENAEGLMINFGNVEEAAPGADLAKNDQIAEDQEQQQQAQPQRAAEEEQQTQDFEETDVAVKEKKKEEKKPQKTQKKEVAKPKPEQKPVEKPREVNKKALFPGRTEGSNAASEGTGTGTGNQGNLAGTPEGSHQGTGTGTGGNSASLSGRALVGSLPKPDYSASEQGRVMIEILVDQQGRVTSAAFRSKGSTTQNNSLVNSALRAARQARFNVDDNAPMAQQGTITYNFRMQ